MLRLTLDTNCIINLFDFSSTTATSVEELSGLVRHALQGAMNLCVTTAVQRDLDRDRDDERRTDLLRKLDIFPVIGGLFRLDASRLGGKDTLASEDEVELETRLKTALFPGLTNTDKRFGKKIADVDHLLAHKLRGRDVFVTDDKEDILRRRDVLRDEFDIVVMMPTEALDTVERTANLALVVGDYGRDFFELTDLLKRHLSDGSWTEVDTETYSALRVRLLRAFPKFMNRLADFRWQQSSQPTGGGYALTDAVTISRLQRDRDPFRPFYARERGEQTIEGLVSETRSRLDDALDLHSDHQTVEELFMSEAERTRTLLEEFLGFLEATPRRTGSSLSGVAAQRLEKWL